MPEKRDFSISSLQSDEEGKSRIPEVFIDNEEIFFCRLPKSSGKEELKGPDINCLSDEWELKKTTHVAFFYKGLLLVSQKPIWLIENGRRYDHTRLLESFHCSVGMNESVFGDIENFGKHCYIGDMLGKEDVILFYEEAGLVPQEVTEYLDCCVI